MLLKYLSLFYRFYHILPERRNLLCFYCRAFIVCSIMLSPLVILDFLIRTFTVFSLYKKHPLYLVSFKKLCLDKLCFI